MSAKFPLIMSDGVPVRTIEELKEHFDLELVLDNYSSGRLIKWLEDRYYDEEAERVKALKSESVDFKQSLCSIFGVVYEKQSDVKLDLRDIREKNKRLERLKKYTANDRFLEAVDSVAFTQEELYNLAYEGTEEIYLCGESFIIPAADNITYIGVNNPVIEFEQNFPKGIDVQGVDFNIENYLDGGKGDALTKLFDKNPILARKFLLIGAEKGVVSAQYNLANCYRDGIGGEQNFEEAVRWYCKAAEQGHAEAQNRLGFRYCKGEGVKKDLEEAAKWYRKAAEQGLVAAQVNLGKCYHKGEGVKKDLEEAARWYRKAAAQGDREAKKVLELLRKECAKGIYSVLRLTPEGLCLLKNGACSYEAVKKKNDYSFKEEKEIKEYLDSAKPYMVAAPAGYFSQCLPDIKHFLELNTKYISLADYYMYLWFCNTGREVRKNKKVAFIEYYAHDLYVSGYAVDALGENYKKGFSRLIINFAKVKNNIKKPIMSQQVFSGLNWEDILRFKVFTADKHIDKKLADIGVGTADSKWENVLKTNNGELGDIIQKIIDKSEEKS